MRIIKKQIKINVPAKKIMEFISKPKNMEIVIPHVVSNYNISKGKPKVGFKFDWKFLMVGVLFSGKWTILEYDFPKKYVAKSEGMINSLWTYNFNERKGITTWDVIIKYEPPKQALSRLAESALIKINEKDAERFLQNVKIVLEK